MPPPFPVLVHTIPVSPTKTLHLYSHPTPSPTPNALLFIGGLGDGPHTIPYPLALSRTITPSFTVYQTRLTSSFSAFGYSSLSQDAHELRSIVRHLRTVLNKQKVVLMGHSTGCQDCLYYTTKLSDLREEERVNGIILQGPVSDREALGMSVDRGELERSVAVAKKMLEEGRGEHVVDKGEMPGGWRGSPVTAYRWLSFATKGGDDDFFSSDLSDEELEGIWGGLSTPVLILPSEKEEWVPFTPEEVEGMVKRWAGFCKPGVVSEFSGLIPGANHRVDNTDTNPEGERWLVERVGKFLGTL
ncbi:hypothetical protein QBC40DRAFT_269866 [Triangularia verruculosa]|uniref:Uncharacterized protein n=1 Tax=Triangularia verruculosa TaxID=2587418 RepID=A0AAN6X5Z8_9PEZI|nr:hypothetical protein QBC40DRAFT_269866 [Triangularia verruculosa]